MSGVRWYALRLLPGKGTCLVPVALVAIDGRQHTIRYEDGKVSTLDRDYVTSEPRVVTV